MFDKIFVFGDSFMYGEETLQHYFDQDQFMTEASNYISKNIILDKDGAPEPPLNSKQTQLYAKFLKNKIKNLDVNEYDYSIGGLLSKHFNVPLEMHACPGNSNNVIYKNFLDCLDTITSKSLIIFGISQPSRKSYYENFLLGERDCMTSCWATVTETNGWQKYQEMDLQFGDDATAQVLQTYSYVTSVKSLCPGKVLFIDPFHYFCDNKYHPDVPWNYINEMSSDPANYKHKNTIKYLETNFKKMFLPGINTVFEEVTFEDGNPIQCILGHYSKYSYQKYIDKVILNEL